MADSGNLSDDPAPPHRATPWTANSKLVAAHPELHHYTNRLGLEGILKTNTLWATHFSNLSDSSEIVLLKEPLIGALEARIKQEHLNKQRESYRARRHFNKRGGVSACAHELGGKFVEANFEVAFRGKMNPAMAEPFICSFCSHANDHKYERANGLLSQWRGYGGEGRFALVFDTQRLDDLLAREWHAHFWLQLELAEVAYFKGPETLETQFPELLDKATKQALGALESTNEEYAYFIEQFFLAATLLKHRGFAEEREIRIVAIPRSEQVIEDAGAKNLPTGQPPLKEVYATGESKKYVALFESLDAVLPITRIIVGPGAKQEEDMEFAHALVSGQVPIMISETPFIG
jgi:hypothetical protein